uniref:Uncharacterized protein n=1 Tax=Anguilla anguilla TaxID=7936 RepID=A0A0E9QKC8_ANGAN
MDLELLEQTQALAQPQAQD